MRVLGGLGLIVLASAAFITASTMQPDDPSSTAILGANIFRAMFQFVAVMWLGCGALALTLRNWAFPSVIGAAATLPLGGYLLAIAAPLRFAVPPTTVGLLLVLSLVFRVFATPRTLRTVT